MFDKPFMATIGFISTTRQVVQLVWRISPYAFLGLLVMALLNGLFPTATLFISSALLQTLAQPFQEPNRAGLPSDVIVLLALMAGATVLGTLLQRLNIVAQTLYQTRLVNHINILIAEKASAIDLACFENPAFHNDMRVAVGEAAYRPLMILQELMILVSTLTSLISLLIVIVLWQPWIVPVILLSSLLMLRVSVAFGGRRTAMVVERSETERRKQYLQTLLTSDQAAKEIRLFHLRPFLLGQYRALLDWTLRQDRQLALRQLISTGAIEILASAVQPVLFSFTALQVLQGAITIGQFNLYTQAIMQLQARLTGQMFGLGSLHESNLFMSKLFRFLAWQPQVEAPRPESARYATTISTTPRIEFRDVSFHYPDSERMVLEHIDVTIAPGEAVALVGENGAGKSTFVKLLAGLYEPVAGQILLDGVDIRHLDRDVLRRHLSVIFQDYTIYHLPAADNIGVGQVERIDDRALIEAAARRSGLDSVIAALPKGYETVLGRFWESGHELSGGQRQLVALARALVRNAPILVLDEPSAALDVYTERRFFQRLLADRAAGQTQTVIFIAHRFTTVRHADRILVLERGHLIEQGSHAELLACGGHYAEMYHLQVDPYEGNGSLHPVSADISEAV